LPQPLFRGLATTIILATPIWLVSRSLQAESGLQVVYPPSQHTTTANQIFLIGTAAPEAIVSVNGEVIRQRSRAGHFSPSFPLQLGKNTFVVQAQGQRLILQVERLPSQPPPPTDLRFQDNSLTPQVNIARLPQEPVCFQAVASPQAQVSVKLGNQRLVLQPAAVANLPPNNAALTGTNQPMPAPAGIFQGCMRFAAQGNLGQPIYQLGLAGKTLKQPAPGQIEILDPDQLAAVTVTRERGGVARTGPTTDFSRLTPLPPGTQAQVTGREGDWLRLNYGAWIRQDETQRLGQGQLQPTLVRSLQSRQVPGWTEVIFPLQRPVPIKVNQGEQTFTLTLYNTTAQTDVIPLNDDPVIQRLDWQQTKPGQIDYQFRLKSAQQWGYKLRYEGSSLVLSLRHPPQLGPSNLPLQGIKILLDPGHGGPTDLGARGPTGLPEKQVTLRMSQLLRDELKRRGATVILTRDADIDLDLPPRVDLINQVEPTLALSVHYNALPDNGDAWQTQGMSMFWYQPQSHSLAIFLQNYLVNKLQRPNYGVFWNNLAVVRPTVSPAVLLELGFMINPQEFEWITDPAAQPQLAARLAEGIESWLRLHARRS
jgi:N-acetylmuramoyl-L-alanine amidase